jgi:beta-lactam-binding protein with PASTA domain
VKFIEKSISALGKLATVLVLAIAFLIGMGGVIYISLQGAEVKVPEIVGKNFDESEKELEALGLRLKKRADRYSQEPPNTILEQLPKPGETVKSGQLILVVTSKPDPEGKEAPATIQKGNQQIEDDSEKIGELISDKPRKKDSNANTNSNRKKASTTRDIEKNANTDSNTATKDNKNLIENNTNKETKSEAPPPGNKQTGPSGSPKPAATKTPSGGDIRERRIP